MKLSFFKTLFFTVVLTCSFAIKSFAGLKWIDIGVNGLTCSMCTRSVEMSVSRLEFVDSVVMSLEVAEGKVYVKNDAPVDFKKIAKAIVDAGFSVRFIRLVFNFSDISVSQDGSFTYQAQVYRWLQFNDSLAKGDVALKLVDEDFLPRKESARWKKKIALLTNSVGQQVFHVVQEI